MGLLKHAVPRSVRGKLVEKADRLPGPIRKNLANILTIGGTALVVAGAAIDKKHPKLGFGLRAVGHTFDDFDGDTARALGIASKNGAFLDATADKLKIVTELKVLWRHTESFGESEKAKRRLALSIIMAKHGINATLNVSSQLLGLEPKSSGSGQANMWADGAALGFFAWSDMSESPAWKERFANLGYGLVVIGLGTGAVASSGYALDLIKGLSNRDEIEKLGQRFTEYVNEAQPNLASASV